MDLHDVQKVSYLLFLMNVHFEWRFVSKRAETVLFYTCGYNLPVCSYAICLNVQKSNNPSKQNWWSFTLGSTWIHALAGGGRACVGDTKIKSHERSYRKTRKQHFRLKLYERSIGREDRRVGDVYRVTTDLIKIKWQRRKGHDHRRSMMYCSVFLAFFKSQEP